MHSRIAFFSTCGSHVMGTPRIPRASSAPDDDPPAACEYCFFDRFDAPAAAAGCATESAQEQEENLESFAQWLEEADSTDDEAEEGGD